jgi:hypothetical protein
VSTRYNASHLFILAVMKMQRAIVILQRLDEREREHAGALARAV